MAAARRHGDTYKRLSNQTYTSVVTPAFKRCQVHTELRKQNPVQLRYPCCSPSHTNISGSYRLPHMLVKQ